MGIPSFVTDHIMGNKVPYIVVVFLVGSGVVGGAYGQQWLTSQINVQMDLRMTGLETDVSDIKLILLHQQLRDLETSRCRTPGNSALLDQIERLQAEHRKQTKPAPDENGYRYDLPSCEALGVLNASAGIVPPEALADNG